MKRDWTSRKKRGQQRIFESSSNQERGRDVIVKKSGERWRTGMQVIFASLAVLFMNMMSITIQHYPIYKSKLSWLQKRAWI